MYKSISDSCGQGCVEDEKKEMKISLSVEGLVGSPCQIRQGGLIGPVPYRNRQGNSLAVVSLSAAMVLSENAPWRFGIVGWSGLVGAFGGSPYRKLMTSSDDLGGKVLSDAEKELKRLSAGACRLSLDLIRSDKPCRNR